MATKKNRTHASRAARALQQVTELSYNAALNVIRRAPVAPRPEAFNDAAFTAEFLARHATAPAGTATGGLTPELVVPASLAGCSFGIVINDDIGYTAERFDWVELFSDMQAAIVAAPSAGTWEGDTWTVAVVAPADIVWPDSDGDFVLANGSHGNPGCGCGNADAVIKVYGEYLCAEEAVARGHAWNCNECRATVASNDSQSSQHGTACSLHPANEVTVDATPAPADDGGGDRCRRCRERIRDLEGYDGFCGNCADVIETTCAVCGGGIIDDPAGSDGVLVHDPEELPADGWDNMDSFDLDSDHTPHNAWD